MKKIKSFAAMLLVALTTMVSFTSCEDEGIAYDLEGCWKGKMEIYTDWSGHRYYSTYTEIEFYRSSAGSTGGTGYWIDHYSGAPRDYVANHIRWSVSNGSIHIIFQEERSDLWIDDYSLSRDYFEGYIRDGQNSVRFNMVHTSSPNWYNYDYGYDYWYSKEGTGFDSRSADNTAPEMIARPKRMVGGK